MIAFDPRQDIAFLGGHSLPEHPNAMRMAAFGPEAEILREALYFSVGGGFVVEGGPGAPSGADDMVADPFPFRSGNELIALAQAHGCSTD